MSSNVPSFFIPPQGLFPNEQVIWTRQDKPSSAARALVSFGLLFGAIFLFASAYSASIILAGVSIVFILIFTLPFFLSSRSAHAIRYYLTTSRLVQTNHDKIQQEVARSLFKGRPLSQFLQKKLHRIGQSGRPDVYTMRVLDPNTGNLIMNLGVVPPESLRNLEVLMENVYCQYCGRQSDPKNTTCSECGANL